MMALRATGGRGERGGAAGLHQDVLATFDGACPRMSISAPCSACSRQEAGPERALGRDLSDLRVPFTSGDAFAVLTRRIARDTAVVELGLETACALNPPATADFSADLPPAVSINACASSSNARGGVSEHRAGCDEGRVPRSFRGASRRRNPRRYGIDLAGARRAWAETLTVRAVRYAGSATGLLADRQRSSRTNAMRSSDDIGAAKA